MFAAIYGCGSSPSAPSAAAGSRTLYVSTTGATGTTGDERALADDSPCRGQLKAGDTLYMRGGTYEGSENTIDSARGVVPKAHRGRMP